MYVLSWAGGVEIEAGRPNFNILTNHIGGFLIIL